MLGLDPVSEISHLEDEKVAIGAYHAGLNSTVLLHWSLKSITDCRVSCNLNIPVGAITGAGKFYIHSTYFWFNLMLHLK